MYTPNQQGFCRFSLEKQTTKNNIEKGKQFEFEHGRTDRRKFDGPLGYYLEDQPT